MRSLSSLLWLAASVVLSASCLDTPTHHVPMLQSVDSSVDANGEGGMGDADASKPCTKDEQCTDAMASHCDPHTGKCRACDDSSQCTQIKGAPACTAGVGCFECSIENLSMCTVGAPACINHGCAKCKGSSDCASVDPKQPACAESGACVECTDKDATACKGGTPVCLAGGENCVQCNVDMDCKEAAKAKCDTKKHECVPCDENGDQCGHIADKGVCSAGTCVQCTQKKAAACLKGTDQFVCDAGKHACDMDRKVHSKTLCNGCVDSEDSGCQAHVNCVSDDECLEGQACVDVPAGGGVRVCLQVKDPQSPCKRPYTATTDVPVSSADGADVTVCTFGADTTCRAHADYHQKRCGTPKADSPDQDELGSGDNAKCGVEGLNDGYCVWVDSINQYRCTVPCRNDVLDCPDTAPKCDSTPTPDVCTF